TTAGSGFSECDRRSKYFHRSEAPTAAKQSPVFFVLGPPKLVTALRVRLPKPEADAVPHRATAVSTAQEPAFSSAWRTPRPDRTGAVRARRVPSTSKLRGTRHRRLADCDKN